jgi:hypothetical protein
LIEEYFLDRSRKYTNEEKRLVHGTFVKYLTGRLEARNLRQIDHILQEMKIHEKEMSVIEEENSEYSEGGSDSESEDDDYTGIEKRILYKKINNYRQSFMGMNRPNPNFIQNSAAKRQMKKNRKNSKKPKDKIQTKVYKSSKLGPGKKNNGGPDDSSMVPLPKNKGRFSSKSNTRSEITSRLDDVESLKKFDFSTSASNNNLRCKFTKKIEVGARLGESRANDSELSFVDKFPVEGNFFDKKEYASEKKDKFNGSKGSRFGGPNGVGKSSEFLTKSLLKMVKDEREIASGKIHRKTLKLFGMPELPNGSHNQIETEKTNKRDSMRESQKNSPITVKNIDLDNILKAHFDNLDRKNNARRQNLKFPTRLPVPKIR